MGLIAHSILCKLFFPFQGYKVSFVLWIFLGNLSKVSFLKIKSYVLEVILLSFSLLVSLYESLK